MKTYLRVDFGVGRRAKAIAACTACTTAVSSGAGLAQIPGSDGSEFAESADCNCSCQTAEASSCEVPKIDFSSSKMFQTCQHCHSTATSPQLEVFTVSPQHPSLALMCQRKRAQEKEENGMRHEIRTEMQLQKHWTRSWSSYKV